MRAAPTRVLVVRDDGVGDTVLTAPLLTAIRERAPGAEIAVLGSAGAAGVLACIPGIDRVWTVDDASVTRRLALGRALGAERFDVAICVSEKWWPHVWARASGAAVRIGLDPGRVQPLKSALLPAYLTHRVAMPCDPTGPSAHEVERYLSLLQPLGLDTTPPSFTLSLPGTTKDLATRRLRDTFAPGLTPIAVQVSRKWGTEGWPATTAADVCAHLLRTNAGIALVLLAGSSDADITRAVVGRLACIDPARVLDAGRTTFVEWASLIHACQALVTMDTAAVHVAAALGVPVVDVFENHRFAHVATRWAPWNVKARTIRRPARGRAPGDASTLAFAATVADALGALL